MKCIKKVFILVIFMLVIFISNAQSLKVMTYNIRLDIAGDGDNNWNLRKDFFTSQIQFYAPDIFGIQEALPNQVLDISNALPSYIHIGFGREENGQGESSNIFYDKNRLEIKKSSTFWLSDTPEKVSKGWDAAYNRVCTYALFKDVKTEQLFWVFNTHLDHIGQVARNKGLGLIMARIAQFNTKKYPVIFMGDLNSEPTENRIIALKNTMDDSREIAKESPFGPLGTFNNFKHNEAVNKRIDYIFLSKNSIFKVKKYAVLSDSKDLKYPSDHLPVYVEIDF
ncbi:endonuclease/exonuclease/phosphatase family protein [Flavobacterium frigoris]|uniref:Metal-dependent hydrolase, endonuclease/exonuclease/phosphatase family n=1 Tax=Flavobacterium frigoris TaxID=229204 RepID=A0A1H9HCY4_FLAFI|nr:endonuclease/exonuclease/phosphatase family protein [Flavobacterium frigoris]SEQ60172.1 Metal-dependent hydrolase, endonuclease/exonuclease/phosphatase family [Flavobacterium frigoris]